MKKTLLSLALLTAAGTAHADYGNARVAGMSGAAYATGNHVDGALYNPSLGASFDENDDFALTFDLGAFIEADKDLLDDLDDLSDFLDELDALSDYQNLTPAQAQRAIDYLQTVESQEALVDAGGGLSLAIPNNTIALNFIYRARLTAKVATDIDPNDYQRITDSIADRLETDSLQSSIHARGALVTDVGVTLAKGFDVGSGRLLLGATPKYVTVETFVYDSTLQEFDEDDFDADNQTLESSSFNVDAGMTYILGNVRAALAVNNALSEDYDTVDGDVLELKPRVTAALGYQSQRVRLEGAVDVSATPDLATGVDRQAARAGIELSPVSWLHFRAGIQTDLEDNFNDTYSVGIGLSPGWFNVDLVGIAGDEDSAGAALQLGLRF